MFFKDMGIDLGTANTLVFVKNKGIIVNEPSVVAKNTATGEVLAVGDEAKEMIGRTPGNIVAIRPMKDGVIADFEITQAMLKYFIRRASAGSIFAAGQRIVICVPSGVTEVEKRAVIEASIAAGAKEKHVHLIEEPMAAAIGAGLPVDQPTGSMIVDIGGGTTEVAVISLGGIVTSKSIRIAGDALDACIFNYIKREYNLAIGDRSAEEIKITAGSAFADDEKVTKQIRGRDLVSGLPKSLEITSDQIREALAEPVNAIVDAVKVSLEKTPPELASDIMESGIILAGGGAMLRSLDKLIANETNMPVHVAKEPLNCVVLGTGMALDNIDTLKSILITSKKLKM